MDIKSLNSIFEHTDKIFNGHPASMQFNVIQWYHRNWENQTFMEGLGTRAFVMGNHRRPVNSPHKGPVTRKMIPFDDVIMIYGVYGAGYRSDKYVTTVSPYLVLTAICKYLEKHGVKYHR